MSDATSGPLRDAYEAIQANQLPKARGILSVYVAEKPNDPDAWWLYSYAAESPTEARKSLENVLRLDPMYPGARDLLNEINQTIAATTIVLTPAPLGVRKLGETVPPSASPVTSATDDPFDDLDDFDEDDDDDDEESGFTRRRILLAIGGFAILVLVVVFIFVILPKLNPQPSPVPTNIAQTTLVATIEATTDSSVVVTPDVLTPVIDITPSVEPIITEEPSATSESPSSATNEVPTPSEQPSTTGFDGFYAALSNFTVTPDSILVESTSLGSTLSATVCLQNQGELRTAIPSAINGMAATSAEAPADTQFIGVKFINCADNSLLRYVVVPIAEAQAFASGTLTAAQLRATQRNITR